MEIDQSTLVLLDERSRGHVHLPVTRNLRYLSGRIDRSGCHQKHPLEFLAGSHGLAVVRAEFEREQDFSRVSVDQEVLSRLDLEFCAPRKPRSVHSHHWGDSQGQRVHVGSHRTIDCGLHVEGFFCCSAPDQFVRHGVGLIRQNRPISHHVWRFFSLEDVCAVTDNDDGFYHILVIIYFAVFSFIKDFCILDIVRLKQFCRDKAVICEQQRLVVLIGRAFIGIGKRIVLVICRDVDFAVLSVSHSRRNFVQRDIFLNGASHAVVD